MLRHRRFYLLTQDRMLLSPIRDYLQGCQATFNVASSPRQPELVRLSAYLAQKQAAGTGAQLVVICTHNSRRSHLGQFWLASAAAMVGADLVAYSGGTEATACHPNTLAALARAGASINRLADGANPHYAIAYGTEGPEQVVAYSKHFAAPPNPGQGFAAIMVCNEADLGCPVIPGAEARFALPYTDPKHADQSAAQDEAYDLACKTIAQEMLWVIENAKAQTA